MSALPLSPDSARFKPLLLLKKTRASVVTAVVETATRKQWIARCLQLPGGGAEAALLQGIDRLSKALRTLSHPALPVFDRIVEGSGGTWMLFEHRSGTLLIQYLEHEAEVSDRWIIWWLHSLLQALEVLHAHKPPFIVGYLDPSDLMVHEQSLWLLDLGLFEDIFPETAAAWLVDHPFTPFIAPERRNTPQQTAGADLFSAGAVAFWLLTGRAPVVRHPGDHTGLLEALHDARPHLPAAVSDLVVDLLSFYPSHRPASATEAHTRLQPWVQDMAGVALPGYGERDELFAADPTRSAAEDLRAPPPVVYKTEPVPPAPPLSDRQEFWEDARWAIRRHPWAAGAGLVGALGVLVGLGLLARLALSPGTAASPAWLMTVASGQVLGRDDPSDTRWHPVERVAAGTSVATLEGAVLDFRNSALTLPPKAIGTCLGQDGDTLQLRLDKGSVQAQTGPSDSVDVHADGVEVIVSAASAASIAPHHVECRTGTARVTQGDAWKTLTAGTTWPPP